MTRKATITDDDSGATAIEYGLVAGLISIAIIGSLTFFAGRTIGMWDYVSSSVQEAFK